jgi:hypothetical protein
MQNGNAAKILIAFSILSIRSVAQCKIKGRKHPRQ